ncbi:putative ribosomal RNA methyltransferase NOP2 [Dirofilaria immitis]|nr:putative ribosomal RNA methyltransferase NOP2 [Dirofilaria immitis]
METRIAKPPIQEVPLCYEKTFCENEENVRPEAVKRKRKQSVKEDKSKKNIDEKNSKDQTKEEEVKGNARNLKSEKISLFENDNNVRGESFSGLNTTGDDSDSDMESDCFSSTDLSESYPDDLPVEKKSRKLEQKKKRMSKKFANDELLLNIENDERYNLPSVEEIENELKEAPNLKIIKQRISDVFQVLNDFKNRRDSNRSRGEYISVLIKDLCSYYGYNEYLIQKFMDIFPNGTEILEFLEANEQPRPVIIRANSLKTRRAELARNLINRGMNVDPAAEWTKVGLIVYDSQVPVGMWRNSEYLAGHYMLQGLSSLLPVMALAPQPNETILDVCAAPGGKSSHIAALMKNTGVLFANDSDMQRCRAIIVNNAVVSNLDGREFAKIMPQGFDRVLLDAPCSGTGVIWKDGSVKTRRDSQNVQRCHTLQRQLILAALDSINANSRSGGYLVYSTCSVLVEENEAVVDYALRKRNCKLVPMGLDIGVQGFTKFREHRFHLSLSLTRRYYPHIHNIDGFFSGKIQEIIKFKDNNSAGELKDKNINIPKNNTENSNSERTGSKAKVSGWKMKSDTNASESKLSEKSADEAMLDNNPNEISEKQIFKKNSQLIGRNLIKMKTMNLEIERDG